MSLKILLDVLYGFRKVLFFLLEERGSAVCSGSGDLRDLDAFFVAVGGEQVVEVALQVVFADLRVSLINPASTEVPVFSGERDGAELYLRGVALRGFPGDESANGVWTLKVVDTRSGQVGTIERFGLTLTSRWD